MTYKIGVDGGGTKTECILVDETGRILARHIAPGCNPSVAGSDQARLIITDALCSVVAQSKIENPESKISTTHIYSAGNRAWWRETAAMLTGFGKIVTGDDSHPVLELATNGQPGLVLHAGTGSFVAARAPDGTVHYAGGIGWRFGDPGSGYDLGRRAIGRALLELQGWAPASRLGPTVRDQTQLGESADAAAVTRFFYLHADPNRQIAALAPAVLRLAAEGDHTALQLVSESVGELVTLATRVAAKLFAGLPLDTLPVGLSGPILNHPVVVQSMGPRAPFAMTPITEPPIEGVRRILLRAT